MILAILARLSRGKSSQTSRSNSKTAAQMQLSPRLPLEELQIETGQR